MLIALLVATSVLLNCAPSFAAVHAHPLLSTFGQSGGANGGVQAPTKIAVGRSTGRVYLLDFQDVENGSSVLRQFDADGDPVAFSDPSRNGANTIAVDVHWADSDVAVDNSGGPNDGNIYVLTEFSDSTLYAFDSTGAPLAGFPVATAGDRCGVAVDGAGRIWTQTYGGSATAYDSSGNEIAGLLGPSGGYCHLAFDSAGVLYVAQWNGPVEKWQPDGLGGFTQDPTTPVVDPGPASAVSVDPESDNLFVAHPTEAVEYGAGGEQVAFGAGHVGNALGIAVSAFAHKVYVSDYSLTTEGRVEVFGNTGTAAPGVETPVAQSVSKQGATISVSVNPYGSETSCAIEFVSAAQYEPAEAEPYAAGSMANCDPATLGSGYQPVNVSAALTGLMAGTGYHARVTAENADGTTSSNDIAFTTDPVAAISRVTIEQTSATTTSARARINPLGDETAYQFEYGTSTNYGSIIPATPQSIGDGTTDVEVGAEFSSLDPAQTYHLRLVAMSAAGTVRSPDREFSVRWGSTALPDGRAFEQISPVDKNGGQIDMLGLMAPAQAAQSGNRVMSNIVQCLPGATACTAERQAEGSLYSFDRTSSGWVAEELMPPLTGIQSASAWLWNVEDRTAVYSGDGEDGKDSVFTFSGGTYNLVGPAIGSEGLRRGPPLGVGASADLSRTFVIDSSENLGWPFDPTIRSGNISEIIEYVGAGNSQPLLVGVTGPRGSTAVVSRCGTRPGGAGGHIANSISANGRIVYFTAVAGAQCTADGSGPLADQLWARIDESRSVLVSGRSPEYCTTPECQSSTPKAALFLSASKDGSRAVFISEQRLTDAARQGSTNMYMYDFDRPAGAELLTLSEPAETASDPGVDGVVAAADDLSAVYFSAQGAFPSARSPRGERPSPGDHNIYLWQRDSGHPNGRLQFIAAVTPKDSQLWAQAGASEVNVTPDGHRLLFASAEDLDPAHTNTRGTRQIFLYDAPSNTLKQISVGRNGFNDDGNGDGKFLCNGPSPDSCTADPLFPTIINRSNPAMSRDGSVIVFSSPAALTPGATDYVPTGATSLDEPVYRHNIYRYKNGEVALILSGSSSLSMITVYRQVLIGTDATGDNIFIKTPGTLSASDTDNGQVDFYDARVCTEADPCINVPVRAKVCAGDACQGLAGGAPAPPLAATVTFVGPGNLAATTPAKKAPVKARVLTKTVRGKRFRVNVRVPAAGRITLSGGSVRTVRRTAGRAGTYSLAVSLTKSAERALKRKHKLHLKLGVRYARNGAAVTTSRLTIAVLAKKSTRSKRASTPAARSRGGVR